MEYSSSQKTIIQTLIYSDIFDYPLTREEVWKYAISEQPLHQANFLNKLLKPSFPYIYHRGFYVLKSRKEVISLRLSRQIIAQQKLFIAKQVSKLLSLIPTVRFIGITGTLSMLNTDEEDDIDFFIITQHNTIWITRLLILALLECIGKRRKRGEVKAQDKICVNLIIDEAALALPVTLQEIYTAHEVVQIQPLFDRNNTYVKFLHKNVWVTNFLPNAIKVSDYQSNRVTRKIGIYTLILCYFVILFNPFAKILQLWYMKKQYTSDIINDNMLAFFEEDTRRKVLREYERRVKEYKIPRSECRDIRGL